MPPAIRTPITPAAIHRSTLPGNVPVPEMKRPIRGFTNIPGYTFPDENIETTFIPEDYWQTGKTYTGEALRNLPPEEIEKFEQVKKQAQRTMSVSIDDVARMTPKEQVAAVDKMIGPRPQLSTLKENLIAKAENEYVNYYIQTAGRHPSQNSLADFHQKIQNDTRILSEAKLHLQEYENYRAAIEKQINDTRTNNKIIAGRKKEIFEKGREKINLLPPEQQKEVTINFHKAVHSAISGDPEKMEDNLNMALMGIPGVAKVDQIGAEVRARIQAKISEGERQIGRPFTSDEKRSVIINDPWGLLGPAQLPEGLTWEIIKKNLKKYPDKSIDDVIAQYKKLKDIK